MQSKVLHTNEKESDTLEKLFIEIDYCLNDGLLDIAGLLWRFILRLCRREKHLPKIAPDVFVQHFLKKTSEWLLIKNNDLQYPASLLSQCDIESDQILHNLCEYFSEQESVSEYIYLIKSNIISGHHHIKYKHDNPGIIWRQILISLREVCRIRDVDKRVSSTVDNIINQAIRFFISSSINLKITHIDYFEWSYYKNYLISLIRIVRSLRNNELLIDWKLKRLELEKIRAPLIMKVEENHDLNISTIERLCEHQYLYSHDMIDFIRSLILNCEMILGEAPCAYSVYASGSYARYEISIYSDLEYFIVLQSYDDVGIVKPYFELWVKLFQLQIDMLGESAGNNCRLGLRLDSGLSPMFHGDELSGKIGTKEELFKNIDIYGPECQSLLLSLKLWGNDSVDKSFREYCLAWSTKEDFIDHSTIKQPRYRNVSTQRFHQHRLHLGKVLELSQNYLYYVDTKADLYQTFGFIAQDLAYYLNIDITGLSTCQIIQQLVDHQYVSLVFGRLWQQSVMLCLTLRLKGELFDAQQTKPSFIIAKNVNFEPSERVISNHPDNILSCELRDLEQLSKFVGRSELNFYKMNDRECQYLLRTLIMVAEPLFQARENLDWDWTRYDPLQELLKKNILGKHDPTIVVEELVLVSTYVITKNIQVNEPLTTVAVCGCNDALNDWCRSQSTDKYYAVANGFRHQFYKAVYLACESLGLPNSLLVKQLFEAKDERGLSLAVVENQQNWQAHLATLFALENPKQDRPAIVVNSKLFNWKSLSEEIVEYIIAVPRRDSRELDSLPFLDRNTGLFNIKIANTQTGNHLTIALLQDVHLKVSPELPLNEASVKYLCDQFFSIDMLPETDFWRFECRVNITMNYPVYPVLVSQTQKGTLLNELLSENPKCLEYLSDDDYGQWFLYSVLTDPEDAKPGNFTGEWKEMNNILQLKLHCFDNDRAFVPAFTGDTIRQKSIFYYCDQLYRPFSPKVIQSFLAINPQKYIEHWLEYIIALNDRYISLFQNGSNLVGYTKDGYVFNTTQNKNAEHSIGVLLIKRNIACILLEKIQIIQEILSTKKTVAPAKVLKRIHRRLFLYNEKFFKAYQNPLQRFVAATATAYNHTTNIRGQIASSTTSGMHQLLLEIYDGKIPRDLVQTSSRNLRESSELLNVMINSNHNKDRALKTLAPVNKPKKQVSTQIFKTLTYHSQEWVLERINWGRLTVNQQQTIIEFLINASGEQAEKLTFISRLKLRGSLITRDQLKVLLASTRNLKEVLVKDCKNLKPDLLSLLIVSCSKIEIVRIYGIDLYATWQPSIPIYKGIYSDNLRILEFHGCDQLTYLNLRVSSLESLIVDNCRSLYSLDLGEQKLLLIRHIELKKSTVLKSVILNVSSLTTLIIEDCQDCEEVQFYDSAFPEIGRFVMRNLSKIRNMNFLVSSISNVIIDNCNLLERLNFSAGAMNTLKNITIQYCQNLKYISFEKSSNMQVPVLQELFELLICSCPLISSIKLVVLKLKSLIIDKCRNIKLIYLGNQVLEELITLILRDFTGVLHLNAKKLTTIELDPQVKLSDLTIKSAINAIAQSSNDMSQSQVARTWIEILHNLKLLNINSLINYGYISGSWSGIQIPSAIIPYADFSDIILSDANLYATDLSFAQLKNAQLTRANLTAAKLNVSNTTICKPHSTATRGLFFSKSGDEIFSVCTESYIHVWRYKNGRTAKLLLTSTCPISFYRSDLSSEVVIHIGVTFILSWSYLEGAGKLYLVVNDIMKKLDSPHLDQYHIILCEEITSNIYGYNLKVFEELNSFVNADFHKNFQPANQIRSSADGNIIAFLSSSYLDRVFVVNKRERSCIEKVLLLERYRDEWRILSLAVSNAGDKIIVVDSNHFITSWDVSSDKRTTRPLGSFDLPNIIDIGDNEVQLVEVVECNFSYLAISPMGNSIAAIMDKEIFITDMETLHCIKVLDGHSKTVTCTAYSPSGKEFASGSCDGTIRLWDLEKYECIRILNYINNVEVTALAYSPEGDKIAVGGNDGSIILYDISSISSYQDTITSPHYNVCVEQCDINDTKGLSPGKYHQLRTAGAVGKPHSLHIGSSHFSFFGRENPTINTSLFFKILSNLLRSDFNYIVPQVCRLWRDIVWSYLNEKIDLSYNEKVISVSSENEKAAHASSLPIEIIEINSSLNENWNRYK